MAFSDDFNRADDASLGVNWNENTPAAVEILSNKAHFDGSSGFATSVAVATSSGDFTNGTVEVEFEVSNTGSWAFLYARFNDTTDEGYMCYVAQNLFQFGIGTTGSTTSLVSTAFTPVVGVPYKMSLTLSGNTKTSILSFADTGVEIAKLVETADTTYTGSGSTGISAHTVGTVDFDNFSSTGEALREITMTGVLHDGTSVIASESNLTVHILNFLTGDREVSITGVSTDASGNMSVLSDVDLGLDEIYSAFVERTNGQVGFIRRTNKNWPRIYVNNSDLESGAYTAVKYDGLGIPGNEVPATGAHGAAFGYPALDLPTEDNDEFRFTITSAPAVTQGGSIVAQALYDDSSFDFEVSQRTAVAWTYTLYKNNVEDTTGMTANVNFASDELVIPPAGSMSMTGQAPTATIVTYVDVPVGSMSMTGQAPTATATENVWVDVPVGSMSLTGYAPSLSGFEEIVTPPAGAMSLTGFAPTALIGDNTVIVPVGSMSLTGYAPTVVAESDAVRLSFSVIGKIN